MKTLKLLGHFCGVIFTIILPFVMAIGTMALTNALSPEAVKEKLIMTAGKIVDLMTGQLAPLGLPETYVEWIRVNIGPEQFVTMFYIIAFGFLVAIFWFIIGRIKAHLLPPRDKPTIQKTDIPQGPASATYTKPHKY